MLYNIPNALGEHDTRVVVIYTVIPISKRSAASQFTICFDYSVIR